MKKLMILLPTLLLVGCSSTREVVDYDLFKNELNTAIQEGFPESTYRVK